MRSRDYLSVHRELPTSTFALASSSQSTALTIEPAAARRLTLQYPPAVVMSVTLHTDLGPLKIEVYCEATPKTAENFLALCATGYYDGVPFHRNVAGFMVQTGDGELRTGKGGRSIWGGRFEDEIRPALRHNARGVVSMANSGPASNHSQFFVTYGSHPHLDGRNTVFGKVGGILSLSLSLSIFISLALLVHGWMDS